MSHRIRGALLVGGALLATAAPASATTPGHWTPVTGPLDNLTQVGLARTPDGMLHVAWPAPESANPDLHDLLQSIVSPDGRVTPAAPIVSGWSDVGNLALVDEPSGLRAY